MFIAFCTMMYKARKYFQKYPIIHLNSIFNFMWREALVVQKQQFFWRWWWTRKLAMQRAFIYHGLSKKPDWCLVSITCALSKNNAEEECLWPLLLHSWLGDLVCVYISFKWVTLNHLSHKQRWEYFQVQTDQREACLFCQSEAVWE